MTPLRFRVHGMDCPDEAAILRRELGPMLGREDHLRIDPLAGTMEVREAPPGVTPEELVANVVARVARTGMRAERLDAAAPSADAEGSADARMRTAEVVVAAILAVVGTAIHANAAGGFAAVLGLGAGHVEDSPLAARAFYVASIALSLRRVVPRTWAALRALRPDMHLLMTVAVIGAVALGDWQEAVGVAWLFALSLALEAWSLAHTRRSIRGLLDLRPHRVRVVGRDGKVEERPPAEVAAGDRFVVRPGERAPLDGTVREGASYVDASALTGESRPVSVAAGDEVFAGSIVIDGVLTVETTRTAGATRLDRALALVEQASARRGAWQRWVDRFAAVYTPAVLGLALLVAAVPPLLFGASSADWSYRALALLVIACPCALVISTPVAVVCSIAAAARRGVLVRGGDVIERLAAAQVVALDKTGTLTRGEFDVAEFTVAPGADERTVLAAASALEAQLTHPMARAVVRFATEKGVVEGDATNVRVVAGGGVTGDVAGRTWSVGSLRFLRATGHDVPGEDPDASADPVAFVGDGARLVGTFRLRDDVRHGAATIVASLQGEGVRLVVLLTGDGRGPAARLARTLGIDDVRSELLPEGKVDAVAGLERERGRVVMVGDGINDAAALARASVGVAVAATGNDAAMEAADVVLVGGEVGRLPWLLSHARRTLGIVRANVGVSLAVKVVWASLALAGASSLWGAVAADMGVSLVVVFNSLRLLSSSAPDCGDCRAARHH